jgi:valyl-tRNA synthetase
VLEAAVAVLAQVRKAKSDARVSMKTPVTKLTISDNRGALEKLRAGLPDLREAAKAREVELTEAEQASVVAILDTV